jgi:predicted AAA+ superfamily ATPase
LVLDEVQYCPEVVSCIKRKVDDDKRPGLYVLTGSQQWSVLRSIQESLAGRAVFLDLEGFSLSEIAGQVAAPFWLEQYLDAPDDFVNRRQDRLSLAQTPYELLWRGWLPEMDVLPEDLAEDFFSAYVRTYVERDVRLMLDTADWQQFGRFVQLVSALTAQEINFSQLGREIGITPQTAQRWLGVLKATFQWFEFPAFHRNSVKKISSKPKGHFADTGLACHLNRISSPHALGGHPMTGAFFETAVASEIRKLTSTMSRKAQFYHWRSHSGGEVDILLERDNVLYPLEIKLSSRPTAKDARGFKALREHYPESRIAPGLIIAPVDRVEQVTGHDYAIPWDLC